MYYSKTTDKIWLIVSAGYTGWGEDKVYAISHGWKRYFDFELTPRLHFVVNRGKFSFEISWLFFRFDFCIRWNIYPYEVYWTVNDGPYVHTMHEITWIRR